MKSNRIKIFAFKSYKRNTKISRINLNIILLLLVTAAILIGLTSCGTDSSGKISTDATSLKIEAETDEETKNIEKAKKRSVEIASLYKDIYAKAEKTASENNNNQTVISQNDVDKIEKVLIEQGYPVMNSDSKYPAYLENSDCVYKFWESVSESKNVEQEIITIFQTGELFYCHLQYYNGEKFQTGVVVSWDNENEPMVSSANYTEVLDWYLSDNNDFYYQIYPLNRHWDAYTLVRLKPVDRKLFDLTNKYLSHIGYLNNNMFLCDWTSQNYGDLSFNDLLEFFYKINNKDYFYAQNYESVKEPYYCSYIPASLFEETIMPYFDISLKTFRERSLYDSEKDIYPWQEIYCDNVIYYPSVEPEVYKYQENSDGTFTLTVNARCNDYKTDRLFTHQVVIRPLKDGGYKYLSNKITYKSDLELPSNCPRLPQQRQNNTSGQ